MAYLKNRDYSELIDAAAKRGDYRTAAQYEQQRNEKIDGEALGYEKTNRYLDYLKEAEQPSGAYDYLKDYMTSASPGDWKSSGEPQKTLRQIQGSSFEKYKQGADYGALLDSYRQRGQLAMKDTLAETSARTGGMASSYAEQAAQQAYGKYLDAAEEEAYGRYNDELDRLYQIYEAQLNEDNTGYNRYVDNVKFSASQGDRFYSMQQQEQANIRQQEQDEAARRQQELENLWTERSYTDSQAEQERSQLLDTALVRAASGNYSDLAKYYGVSDSEAASWYYQNYIAPNIRTSSGGSGSKKTAADEATDPYTGLSDSAVVNSLTSTFMKKGYLTAEEFSALEERGYTLDSATGRIIKIDTPAFKPTNTDVFNTADHTLEKLWDQGANGEQLAAVLLEYADKLSDEELEELERRYALYSDGTEQTYSSRRVPVGQGVSDYAKQFLKN